MDVLTEGLLLFIELSMSIDVSVVLKEYHQVLNLSFDPPKSYLFGELPLDL